MALLRADILSVYGRGFQLNQYYKPSSREHLRSRLRAYSYSSLPEDDVETIRSIGGPKADVYGEMTANGLRQLMTEISANKDDVFLDLGS